MSTANCAEEVSSDAAPLPRGKKIFVDFETYQATEGVEIEVLPTATSEIESAPLVKDSSSKMSDDADGTEKISRRKRFLPLGGLGLGVGRGLGGYGGFGVGGLARELENEEVITVVLLKKSLIWQAYLYIPVNLLVSMCQKRATRGGFDLLAHKRYFDLIVLILKAELVDICQLA